MKCYTWNAVVLAIVFATVATTALANYKMNFYGVFGDVAGKNYVVYHNERTTKYLFSYNYIPSNFDGLLVGPSCSANWDTSRLTGARVYNVSISGANITEEALVVDNVLHRDKPKLVLFVIHPYLTETYGRKSGFMNAQEYWGALGSIQLLRAYLSKWLIEHGHARREFNEFGADDFTVPQPLARIQPEVQISSPFFVETRSLSEYRDLLQRVRSSGARIAALIPPIEMQTWKATKPAFDRYCLGIESLFHEDEPIIDMNAPEFDEFRKNSANYQDGVHLSSLGARKVMPLLSDRLRQKGLLVARADAAVVSGERENEVQ